MGALNVNAFGGQLFGVGKRDLPDNGAQSATNMQARVNTFAPLNEDGTPFNLAAVGSGGIGLGTISSGTVVRSMFRYPYRDTGATTILGSDKVLSVVKGQLVNDTRERCYLADDGSVGSQLPPYVIHGVASPTARLLGVPAPNTELGYTVNPVAQLTAEHLANLQTVNETIILQKLEVMLQRTWGGTVAGGSTPGYMDNLAASDAAATGYGMRGDKPNQSRVFGIDGAGIAFSALAADYFTWALGVPFTTHTWTSSNATALTGGWGALATGVSASPGNFAAFTYKSFYPVYAFGSDTPSNDARAAILALTQPGKTATDYIMTAPQLAELETRVTDLFEVTNPNIAACISRINFRYLFLTQLMDGKIGSTALANLTTFLTNDAGVQAIITNAYDAFASAVWEKMNKAYTSSANANATYTGTSYTISALFSPTKATSLPLIIAAVKARMTSDGTSAVAPYVSIRPITKAKAFLDADKLGLYQFAAADVQDAVFQASLTLDFTAELYALYTATTIEAMKDLADIPALFVEGGETTAAAVIGARDLLELEIGNLETYYAGLPNVIKATVKAYLKEIGVNDLHGEVDPTGAQLFDTRYYTWTYKNDWSEESQDWAHAAGVVPTAIEVDQNDTVTLTRTGTVPTAYGTISHWCIYRSNTATDKRYQLVAEVPIATTTFVDDLKAHRLQETLSTEAWSLPPTETVSGTVTYLQGLVNMPNNFMLGFIDRTVYPSEVGAPYAFPPEYAVPFAHKIIGIEVFGQTAVVLTQGGPYYLTGSDPSALSKDDPQSNEICVSKRSIAKVGGGVVFASSKGLCIANGQGVQLFMPAPLGKQFWDVLRPDLMQIVEHDGVLYVAYGAYVNTAPTGYWQNLIAIHLASMKITALDTKVTALYVDYTTGSMYVALPHAGSVPQATKAFSALTYRTATWRSKRITLPQEESFAWLQVMGEQSTTSGYGALVKLYGYLTKADGTEVSMELANFTITNINPVRVRPGRFLEFEIEVTSKAQIKNVIFAGEIEDLQGVA